MDLKKLETLWGIRIFDIFGNDFYVWIHSFQFWPLRKFGSSQKILTVKKDLNLEISRKFARKRNYKKYFSFKVYKFGFSMWDIFTKFMLRNLWFDWKMFWNLFEMYWILGINLLKATPAQIIVLGIIGWKGLIDANLLCPQCNSHLRSCPPAQLMNQDDWSSLLIGDADVWPPSKDSYSSFCTAATSFAATSFLSAPPWCVLSKLCNTTHVKTRPLPQRLSPASESVKMQN